MATKAPVKTPIPTTSGFHNFAPSTLQIFTGPHTNRLSSPACQRIMTLLCKTKPISEKPKQIQVTFWQRIMKTNAIGHLVKTKPIKPNFSVRVVYGHERKINISNYHRAPVSRAGFRCRLASMAGLFRPLTPSQNNERAKAENTILAFVLVLCPVRNKKRFLGGCSEDL